MNKNLFLTLLLLVSALGVFAQKNVGIGTTVPEQSAILDLTSKEKGFLMPRMSETERNNILSPAKGLMVYQTDANSGYYFFNGDTWKPLILNEAKSVAADPNDWSFSGSNPPPGSYIGTNGSSSEPLVFKTGGLRTGYLDITTSSAYLGYNAGLLTTGIGNTAVGTNSLSSNTTSNNNTAIGANSQRISTAEDNTSLGSATLYSNTTGTGNVAIGLAALFSNTGGSFNTALGGQALRNNTTGANNFALGYASLFTNTSGGSNIAIGPNALRSNTTGNQNLAIGGDAGYLATGSDNIFIGNAAGYNEVGNEKLYISNTNTVTPLIYGNFAAKFVSIGDVDPEKREAANTSGGYNLLVKGGILTEKVKVALASSGDWSDYVFEPSYSLMPLEDVEAYTKENKHLPNVPSADEMANNGLDIAQTSKMFMEKIEELTLYIIELNREVQLLKTENAALKK